jgi:hypothetical protein
MASFFLILAATLAADPSADSGAAPVERPFHEYQQQVSALLKRESQSKSLTEKAAAVQAMCDMHAEIVHDRRYATSDVLKEYRSRLWSRLTRIKSDLKQQLGRSNRNKQALDDLAALEAADETAIAAADALAQSLSLLDYSQGGPGRLLTFGGRAGPIDWGPDLVDLIERTINPSFWDVVGGPGTIIYYQPLQCLVVRATAEVHGNIGGLIGDVRRAGR